MTGRQLAELRRTDQAAWRAIVEKTMAHYAGSKEERVRAAAKRLRVCERTMWRYVADIRAIDRGRRSSR